MYNSASTNNPQAGVDLGSHNVSRCQCCLRAYNGGDGDFNNPLQMLSCTYYMLYIYYVLQTCAANT